mmetsp:Transcript_2767/g.4970  ORF Transcript_2767/g.4970 Transcript_2767/m.4970 type:complete len:233 (-) Transcript_2767:1101-1799(-)
MHKAGAPLLQLVALHATNCLIGRLHFLQDVRPGTCAIRTLVCVIVPFPWLPGPSIPNGLSGLVKTNKQAIVLHDHIRLNAPPSADGVLLKHLARRVYFVYSQDPIQAKSDVVGTLCRCAKLGILLVLRGPHILPLIIQFILRIRPLAHLLRNYKVARHLQLALPLSIARQHPVANTHIVLGFTKGYHPVKHWEGELLSSPTVCAKVYSVLLVLIQVLVVVPWVQHGLAEVQI